jgi:hypothetical protein
MFVYIRVNLGSSSRQQGDLASELCSDSKHEVREKGRLEDVVHRGVAAQVDIESKV